jgi:hypothetical protein
MNRAVPLRLRSWMRPGGLWLCLAAAAVGPAGCASSRYGGSGYRSGSQTADAGNLTPDEKLLREQSDSFVQENVFGGAATGAIIGCVLGGALVAVLGGSGSNVAAGCGIGAAGGAIAGGVDGYLKAKEAQNQANQVLVTRSVTDDIRKENAKLESAVQTAQRVVANDQKKLEQIRADLAAKKTTLQQARAETAVIRDNSKEIEDILNAARKNRDDFVDARNKLSGGDTAALDQEIAQLNGEIAQLETQLAAVNTSLKLTDLN